MNYSMGLYISVSGCTEPLRNLSTTIKMEYGEHLALQLVPGLAFAIAVIIFCIVLMCFQDGHPVMDEITRLTLGSCFVDDNEVQNDNNDTEDYHILHPRRILNLYRTHSTYITATGVLGLVSYLLWYYLIVKVTFGTCDEEADCFMTKPRSFNSPTPLPINCSNFTLEADSAITCYKTVFLRHLDPLEECCTL